MCSNVPFTEREMKIIKAIKSIDNQAEFRIKGRFDTRHGYLYGGIFWDNEYIPIPWEHVLEKIDEEKRQDRPY